MERVSPTMISVRLDSLSLGPLDIPELSEVGVELEVVDAVSVSGIGLHPNASAFARSLATPPEGVVLALRANDPDLDVSLADASGRRHYGRHQVESGASFWRSTWTWTGEGMEQLLVAVPSTLVARRRALTEVSRVPSDGSDPRLIPPDWRSQLAVLDRFETTYEREPDRARSSRRMAAMSQVREALTRRREHWPNEPPDERLPPVRRLDDAWGRSAVVDALDAVEAAGLSRNIEPFIPAVRAVPFTGMDYDEVPLGVSHLHGCPHVPDDFTWPRWDCPGYDPGPIDEAIWRWRSPGGPGPLTFVAQVNLEEATLGTWWRGPGAGWLLFFVDFDRLNDSADRTAAYMPGAHRVAYVAPESALHVELPPWADPMYGRWGWKERDRQAGLRYIGYGYTAWLTFEPTEVVAEVPLQRAYLNQPDVLPEPLRSWLADACYRASHSDRHWIGGEPNPCQDDPVGEALRFGMALDDLDALERERSEWVQLLQLASDSHTDTMWGDGGLLHFFIRANDLESGRFDRTLLTYQCS